MATRYRAAGRRRAFTFTEVLVAVLILGTILFTLYASFSFGFGVIRLARENVRATQILQEKMEIVRLYNWDQIGSSNFVPVTFQDHFDPTNSAGSLIYSGVLLRSNAPIAEEYRSDLLHVSVMLTWTSSGVVRHREMSTFVSRYGMQNYIF